MTIHKKNIVSLEKLLTLFQNMKRITDESELHNSIDNVISVLQQLIILSRYMPNNNDEPSFTLEKFNELLYLIQSFQ